MLENSNTSGTYPKPKKTTHKCLNGCALTYWIVQPPSSPHRYEVLCGDCFSHVKWGTEVELPEALATHEQVMLIARQPPNGKKPRVRANWHRDPNTWVDEILAFADEFGIACQGCGFPLQLKLAQKGANKGNYFSGCSHYPNCDGTRSLRSDEIAALPASVREQQLHNRSKLVGSRQVPSQTNEFQNRF